jgi:hypothetical protein
MNAHDLIITLVFAMLFAVPAYASAKGMRGWFEERGPSKSDQPANNPQADSQRNA